ncbi:hypothetical protein [Amycolatopsis cihanbeyliensis]|uniref:Uncharacterized protein n=1 Tax=Amycolatopsis cihanbeyliensis TaxID=1128664 RepID=A0A542DHT1_AMYCI|nr:hypothetical protein [Amycolatopsis cihanbeyliensis]TQJ02648.1 hypothetical protein FB471_2383 [Amycolatopsis cihanbeyliensis]
MGHPYGAGISGGAAITAGVLGILIGLWHILGVVLNLGLGGLGALGLLVGVLLNSVVAGTLIPGAILLFQRKLAGRMLVVLGSALALVTYLLTSLVSPSALASPVLAVTLGIPAVATLVLACVPATTNWLESGP